MSMGVNISAKDSKTGKTSPAAADDNIPTALINGKVIQFILPSNLFDTIMWVAPTMIPLEVVVDNGMVPASVPLKLLTTGMDILFPDIIDVYGLDKGLYIKLALDMTDPKCFVRNGRLVLFLDTTISMYVDQDSSDYPA